MLRNPLFISDLRQETTPKSIPEEDSAKALSPHHFERQDPLSQKKSQSPPKLSAFERCYGHLLPGGPGPAGAVGHTNVAGDADAGETGLTALIARETRLFVCLAVVGVAPFLSLGYAVASCCLRSPARVFGRICCAQGLVWNIG